MISVIIPALNEASRLGAALESAGDDVERIVVDGGSLDGTPEVALASGARLLRSPTGRALQMNLGAEHASGESLLFLHADCRLPERYAEIVHDILEDPGVACGAFRLHIDAEGKSLRRIERWTDWRSRLLGAPYGDQGLFLTSRTFRRAGGYPDLPIMEDYELVRRLRRRGKIRIAGAAVSTSARRWQELGPLRTFLRNQFIVAAYTAGVNPERLRRVYDHPRG